MSITMYIHHEIHDPAAMAEGGGLEVDTHLASLGHDFSETWYADESMGHALAVIEFGSSDDAVTHFDALAEHGFAEVLGKVFTIPHADVIGDLDDEARTRLAKWDFFHFLAPISMPGT